MDLLPKSKEEFQTKDYWEDFFKKRGSEAFEWYGEYTELCGIIHKYIKPEHKTLVVGCGNSSLSADMYDVGYRNLTNIDISDVAIRQMVDKNKERREDMPFIKMDVKQMTFKDDEFSAVIDKGTLDAMMTDSTDATNWEIDKMFNEIGRVMKVGGRYIIITLAQDHILKKILNYYNKEGWPVRVHRITEDIEKTKSKEFHMPVFAFILTKFRRMANAPKIFEVAYVDDTIERVDSIERMQAAVKALQHYALVRHQLSQKSGIGEQMVIELHNSKTNSPRYTIHIIDNDKQCQNIYAVFIVPEGRESEWMFCSEPGRLQLAQTARFQRLAIVTLHRDQAYENLDTIKSELSAKVMELAPPNLGKEKVPFLSVGEDIGKRTVRYRGNSAYSGDIVVEDVEVDNVTYRRLVFLNSPNIIQSEGKLHKGVWKVERAKKLTKMMVDPSYLSFQFHVAMVAGLAFMENFQKLLENGLDISVIGLGGGGLPLYINHCYPKCKVDAVDIDPVIVQTAKEWFNFPQNDNLKIHTCNGIDYINKLADKGIKKHAVIFDVDSKDVTVGMSSPPRDFVDKEFLKKVDSILHPQGVFMLNFVCRNSDLRYDIIKDLKSVFKLLLSKKLMDDVNEVIYCIPSSRKSCQDIQDEEKLGKNLKRSIRVLQELNKARDQGDNLPQGLMRMLEDLSII